MITEEYIPFHKVIKLLEDFTYRHIDLNAFGFGNLLEYGKDIEDRTLLYPVLFVVPQTITYDEQQTQYSLSIIIADRLSEDEKNRVDAISNMSMIAKDLIGEIKLGGLQEYFDVDLPITSTSFIERFMDNVGGVALDITLTSLDPLNVCQSFLVPVEYNPLQIDGLFAWYDLQDTSTITLTGGTDITQLLDKSGNDYTLTPFNTPPKYSAMTSGNLSGYYSMYDTNLTGLQHNISSAASFPDGFTMFIVSDYETTDNIRPIFTISSGNTFGTIGLLQSYSIVNYRITTSNFVRGQNYQVNVSGGGIDPNNNAFISTALQEGNTSDMEMYMYGVDNYEDLTSSGVSTLTTQFDYITLGDFQSGGSGDINICEALIYDRKLTDTEYNGIVQYLKNKYQYQYWV